MNDSLCLQIPVEAERLTDSDLVLEQYVSPTAPVLAGFRLDAFSAIKPRITHSPLPRDVDIWQSSLTCLEDRNISPAVLYIQVSAFQVIWNKTTMHYSFSTSNSLVELDLNYSVR